MHIHECIYVSLISAPDDRGYGYPVSLARFKHHAISGIHAGSRNVQMPQIIVNVNIDARIVYHRIGLKFAEGLV
jgi:hypothetical protein